MSPIEPIERVVQHFGNRLRVAKALKLSPTAVYQWKQIPVGRVRRLSELTGIPASELRPDLFGDAA